MSVPALAPAPSPLARLAGVTAPVSPRLYAASGFGLLAVKYAGEAGLAYVGAGALLGPLTFLSPLLTTRVDIYQAGPDWLPWAAAMWTLPFAWIGASMSVRRARDAGLPAFLGLLFFVPFVNYLMMLGFCAIPHREPERAGRTLHGENRVVWAALLGSVAGAAIGLLMVLGSVFVLGEYGGTLFIGTPFVMGVVSAFLLNLRQPRGLLPNLAVGVLTVSVAAGLLMLFALEGALCIAMAAPIATVMALLGVWLGRSLAAMEARAGLVVSVLPLPLLAIVEPPPGHETLHEVVSSIDIAAPPQVVWDNVISFGGTELPPPPEWYFQLGIAYPMRAHIEGTGVGAVRYCEFSTGPFVEPITTWDAPRHLAFDVTETPPTMHEWSPYAVVHAPHLDGILKSRKGEFVLTPLANGGTHLEGHTWYTFAMAPEAWWTLWSDASIHAIHMRVLRHIAGLSEGSAAP
jgi:uncharacterized membrane protein YhaH (DUF805 family)